MTLRKLEIRLAVILIVYLLLVGGFAALAVIANFPTTNGDEIVFGRGDKAKLPFLSFGDVLSSEQALILLAFLAGVSGSFLHAAQSLASYVGNATFKASWTAWYVVRPWIGGILGFAIYFAFRAGLVAGTTGINPYGVVALGIMGGWFSKTATDKLQEVFETLFKTDADKERRDKLRNSRHPTLEKITPSPVPKGTNEIRLHGSDFLKEAVVVIDETENEADLVSESELRVTVSQRPPSGKSVPIHVKNPSKEAPSFSNVITTLFE